MRETIERKLRETTKELGAAQSRAPLTGDFDLNPEVRQFYDQAKPLRPAAVLMPIIQRAEGLTMLLTQRTDHLTHHAGQISFPGGRAEAHDENPVETALRETREEVGIDRSFVEVAGLLENYETGTGFRITPVVGFVRAGFTLTPDAREVAEAFEVPLDFLMNPANHQLHERVWKGTTRQFYAMPYGDRYIWGATAGMIVSLYRTIKEPK